MKRIIKKNITDYIWKIKFEEQYSQFFRRDNWYVYNLFGCEIDSDYVGWRDIHFSLHILGLGIIIHLQHKGDIEELKNLEQKQPIL